MADLGCEWLFVIAHSMWPQAQSMAYRLYARSVCDTTTPLQLQLPLAALYKCWLYLPVNLFYLQVSDQTHLQKQAPPFSMPPLRSITLMVPSSRMQVHLSKVCQPLDHIIIRRVKSEQTAIQLRHRASADSARHRAGLITRYQTTSLHGDNYNQK